MKSRGYFGIGVEGISKPMNFGNLSRTAYGFGASFVFTVAPGRHIGNPQSDTTRSQDHMPWYSFKTPETLLLPDDCRLIGIELTDDAIDLPSFRHPTRAAYILGPEGGSLSPAIMGQCEFIVKIPTRFCVNVATAGAIIMYDRVKSLGRFAERPMRPGGPLEKMADHLHGKALYSGGTRIGSPQENAKKSRLP
jgi:tRNA G18 (ribose-2'-O)-methylase SpoU